MLGMVDERGLHPAAAGALAASVWSLLEPIDRRVLRSDYSDVLLLGKTFTRGRLAWPVGFAIHAANGALFGLAFDRVRRLVPYSKEHVAIGMALAEHVALYPLSYFVDRHHPARGETGIPPLFTNQRAFVQATLRHTLFGVVLGHFSR
jgi:hypothetical protein